MGSYSLAFSSLCLVSMSRTVLYCIENSLIGLLELVVDHFIHTFFKALPLDQQKMAVIGQHPHGAARRPVRVRDGAKDRASDAWHGRHRQAVKERVSGDNVRGGEPGGDDRNADFERFELRVECTHHAENAVFRGGVERAADHSLPGGWHLPSVGGRAEVRGDTYPWSPAGLML